MFCNNCGAELSENSKFCSECGHKIEKKALNIGDKNVIAGDVYGSKEDFHISGNATFINKDDDTSKICACTNCGKHILLLSGFTCTKCQKFVCSGCYNKKYKVCENCAEELEVSESKEKDAIKKIASFLKSEIGKYDSDEEFSNAAKDFLKKQLEGSFSDLKKQSRFSIEMVHVEKEGKPSIYFAEHPVTQKEFKEVMGYNPSVFSDNEDNPVENVSFYEALVFCNELSDRDKLQHCYRVDGMRISLFDDIPRESNELWDKVSVDYSANGYRLPDVEEWMIAARGGNNNENTEYAGSDNFNEVAWCYSNSDNSTWPVCTKKPNSLGIYDLCGNVGEWCFDDIYGTDQRIVKGGDFSSRPDDCRIDFHFSQSACEKSPAVGIRLCSSDSACRTNIYESEIEDEKAENEENEEENSNYSDEEIDFSEQFYLCADEDYDDEVFSEENAKIVLQNIENRMVLVEGGTMKLGNSNFHNDNPVHTATIKDFYLSQVTVTQKLFRFIMGTDKIHYYQEQFDDDLPMEFVGYYDAVAFCNVLSRLAGLEPVYSVRGKTNPADWKGYEFPEEEINIDYRGDFKVIVNRNANGYRLPDGDENEFAYRGGTKSRNFKYAGSNRLEKIAWFDENSNNEMHEVGLKMPNELGLYDMTGNVAELCNNAIIKSGKYNDGYKGGAIESFCRSADCYGRYYGVGFRIARNR